MFDITFTCGDHRVLHIKMDGPLGDFHEEHIIHMFTDEYIEIWNCERLLENFGDELQTMTFIDDKLQRPRWSYPKYRKEAT